MYLVRDVGTSGMNVECGAAKSTATESNWIRKRCAQALDLSPGFTDWGMAKIN